MVITSLSGLRLPGRFTSGCDEGQGAVREGGGGVRFRPQSVRQIPRRERVICIDIGYERKAKLKLFCLQHNVAMTEMLRQMIDHCIKNSGETSTTLMPFSGDGDGGQIQKDVNG